MFVPVSDNLAVPHPADSLQVKPSLQFRIAIFLSSRNLNRSEFLTAGGIIFLKDIEVGERGRGGPNLTGNRVNITILLTIFLQNIYSQMTAKVQTGPFQFISKCEPASEAPSRSAQWPKQDLIKYAAFLNFSKGEICTLEQALSWSFLRKMSIFIQTKNPNQCRIFHKKMMENHACLDSLIADLRTKIEKFEEWYEVYEPSLRNVKHCLQRETALVEKQPTSSRPTVQQNGLLVAEDIHLETGKGKEDLKPTDVDYPEENVQIPKRQTSYYQSRPARPSFGFDSFGEAESAKNDHALNDFDFFNKPSSVRASGNPERCMLANSQKWRECHNTFASYLGQLNKLMAGSES